MSASPAPINPPQVFLDQRFFRRHDDFRGLNCNEAMPIFKKSPNCDPKVTPKYLDSETGWNLKLVAPGFAKEVVIFFGDLRADLTSSPSQVTFSSSVWPNSDFTPVWLENDQFIAVLVLASKWWIIFEFCSFGFGILRWTDADCEPILHLFRPPRAEKDGWRVFCCWACEVGPSLPPPACQKTFDFLGVYYQA